MIRIHDGVQDWGWGILCNFHKAESTITLDVYLKCYKNSSGYAVEKAMPPPPTAAPNESEYKVLPVKFENIYQISKCMVKKINEISQSKLSEHVAFVMNEFVKRYGTSLPLMDPIEHMGIKNDNLIVLIRDIEKLEIKLKNSPIHGKTQYAALYEQYVNKIRLIKESAAIQKTLSDTDTVVMKTELHAMKRVLKRLEYCDTSFVVTQKGRVACEINARDELLISELIFQGVFNDLTSEQCVALLSCLMEPERTDENVKLKDDLSVPLKIVRCVS